MTEEIWHRVQAALDRRQDPFDDPAIVEALAGDPAAAEEVLRLVDGLDALSAATAARPAARRARGRAIAAAIVLLGAGAAWWLAGGQPVPEPTPPVAGREEPPAAPAPSPSRVVRSSVRVTRERPPPSAEASPTARRQVVRTSDAPGNEFVPRARITISNETWSPR